MNIRLILLALALLLSNGKAAAADDYKNSAEFLTLRDSMRVAFNAGDSARFFPALARLETYLLKQNDLHAYYTQRCNEIVFLMNRQHIFEAYKRASNLSQELRERKLDKEMYMAYNMMGHINRYCGNREAAKECFRTVIRMMKEAGYYESMPPIYLNIVNVELDDDPEEAMKMLDEAIEIARKYSPDRVFDIETRKSLSLFNSGNKEAFMKAYQEYRKGVEEGKSSVHGRMMDIYYQVCLGHSDEAVKLAHTEMGEDGREAITMIYERAGRWKEAFESLKQQTSAHDSINNVVLTNSMMGIGDELKLYDAERKATHSRTIMLTIIIAMLILLVAALAYILWARRKHLREIRKAYERILEADKMKTAFIRNVTHEIRTPLNIISGFAQVIADPDLVAAPEERKQLARTMQKNTRLVTTLIDEMLELSLNETTSTPVIKDDKVEMNSLLKELLKEARSKTDTGVELKLESQLGNPYTILTSEDMLRRVVNSVLDNACKNTHEGTITLKASADEQQMTLIVEDTGIGIPGKEAEHIFERFVKLDTFKEGVGLGLPLARMILGRLGGTITLDTSYTQGARFIVTIAL